MKRKEQGAVLVIGLLLLAVATIVGVAGLSGSNMQERIAANQKQQTEAMMAAETGASQSIAFSENPVNWGAETKCIGTDDNWTGLYNPGISGQYEEVTGTDAKYLMRLVCENGLLFVESEGVVRFNGENLAERTVRVHVYEPGLQGIAPVNFVGNPNTGQASYNVPNSNSFEVFGDGDGGPAVAASNINDRDNIRSEIISAGREQNYRGGIESIFFPDPFSAAEKIAAFVTAVKLDADYIGTDPDLGGGSMGTTSDPKVNVITGNLGVSGGVSGAGVLIVEGDLTWSGGVSFDGLVMVLGGTFDINGNGDGGVDGAVYVTNIDSSSGMPAFANEAILINGGGTAEYRHSNEALEMAWNALNPIARALLKLEKRGANINEDLYIAEWSEKYN